MDGAGCFRALVALLDVSPQHRLLDMSGTCSGSLSEALHAAGPGRGLSLSGQVPPGLLIAT